MKKLAVLAVALGMLVSWGTSADGQVEPVVYLEKARTIEPRESNTIAVSCPVGRSVVSGGYSHGTYAAITIITNIAEVHPQSSDYRWVVRAKNQGASSVLLTVRAACLLDG